jgi:RNA-binding protein YlmH
MESTKIPKRIIKKQVKKRVIKKQLKKVDKAIVEIAEMKFENYEEKEEKLDALVFLKNQILSEAEELL